MLAVLPHYDRSAEGLSERRKIIKQCYLAIIAHTDDADLVTSCLSMIANVEEDRDLIIKVAEFAQRFYFDHPHNTAGCYRCMPADTLASIVVSGARAYAFRDRLAEAEGILTRFIDGRAAETSDSKLERLYSQLATVYWGQGEREEALALLQRTYDDYRGKVENPTSLYYLQEFRRRMER